MSPLQPLLESIARQRSELQGNARKRERLRALQRWQVDRLLQTYADYLASPRHRAAVNFFAHDLYGPNGDSWHASSQRDNDLKRVIDSWQRVMPQRALHAIAAALELEALTQTLDFAMLDALGDSAIDAKTYTAAYRTVDRRADRIRQIELFVECGQALDALVVNAWVGPALRMAKLPARVARLTALHEFLERGYAAFVTMGGARELLDAIKQRETTLMQDLLAGRADPFRFGVKRAQIPATKSTDVSTST